MFCLPEWHIDSPDMPGRIDLLKVFEGYQATKEDLSVTLDALRDSVMNAIDSMIGDFSLANYLLGERYPYLQPVDLQSELADLIAVGQPSYRNPMMNATPPVRIVMVNLDHVNEAFWESSVLSCFPLNPIQLPLIDPSMLLVLTIHPQTDKY